MINDYYKYGRKNKLMYQFYGKTKGKECYDCKYYHESRMLSTDGTVFVKDAWCEIYGHNKDNIEETYWFAPWEACGVCSLDHEPVLKYIKKFEDGKLEMQESLF